MRTQISAYLNNFIFTLILGVVALTPLIFATYTTEFFETPKLIFLIAAVLIMIFLWALTWVVEGKVSFTRTPLDIPLLLLLAIILISTFFNDSRFVSLYGNFPRIHGSAISWVAYILFYFVAASNIKGSVRVRGLINILLLSTSLVSLVSLLSFFGLNIFPFPTAPNFNLTGSSFSATALMALLLPLPLISIINRSSGSDKDFMDNLLGQNIKLEKQFTERWAKDLPILDALIISTLFGVTIALTGSLATQVAAIFSLIISLFISNRKYVEKALPMLLIPVLVSGILFGLTFLKLGSVNPLVTKMEAFPKELQLPFNTSWKISASAFRDAPFFGTGPATYLFNFTEYKPIEFNSTDQWNLRFDQSFNEYLQVLGDLGGLGLTALLFLSAVVLGFGLKELLKYAFDKNPDSPQKVTAGALAATSLVALVLLALHATTPVVIITIIALWAMLMSINKSSHNKVEELSLGIKASKVSDSNLVVGDILPIILLGPIFVLVIFCFWQLRTSVLADYYHRQALNSASTNGLETYNYLVQAERLNPRIDLYRVDLAQTNFGLANTIALSKAPNEASPSGSLNEQDIQNIQQLISQSIDEARASTVLSPRNAQNWEVLAAIYRQISGVAQNALNFSLDAYGQAIKRDPLNPILRVNVGGVYYSIQNYDLAIRFFSDAINLKPDYANAYYNLSVTLKDKGDIQSAVQVAEQLLTLLDQNSQDYKVASEYLDGLKAQVASNSAETGQDVPPAAEQNQALQQKNLPKVIDLPNQKVSTPEAVKKNPNSPVSIPTPTPTPR